MDWEKNYGYEEDSSSSEVSHFTKCHMMKFVLTDFLSYFLQEEDEVHFRYKEEHTTRQHIHSNTYFFGKLKLGFLSKVQKWADRILNVVGTNFASRGLPCPS